MPCCRPGDIVAIWDHILEHGNRDAPVNMSISILPARYMRVVSDASMSVVLRRVLTKVSSQSDPEAAKIVFECGAPVMMVPLEVTHTALATPAVLQRLSVRSTPFLGLMRKLLLFFAQTYREVFSFEHPPLHDPLAVFYVACPEAFKARSCRPCELPCILSCSKLGAVLHTTPQHDIPQTH